MGDKGKKDKGKREQQKKAQLDLKAKRKKKKEKKKYMPSNSARLPFFTPFEKGAAGFTDQVQHLR